MENNTVRHAVAPSRIKKAVTKTIKGMGSKTILKSCTQEYTPEFSSKELI